MLNNRTLREYGFIFPNNTDPRYLKALINLGSRPIFIYIKNNERIISEGFLINNNDGVLRPQWIEHIKSYENWCNPDNYNPFNFDCLSISEIKTVLSMKIMYPFGIPIIAEIKSFYFFWYLSFMLINKCLANNGYIFVKNADPLYIRMLIDLGSIPIFVYIKDNKRIISEGSLIDNNMIWKDLWVKHIKHCKNWCDSNNYNTFNFDCLSISEIKKVLSMKINFFHGTISCIPIESFYFIDI